MDRATTSPAILEMEYVGKRNLWLSPRAACSGPRLIVRRVVDGPRSAVQEALCAATVGHEQSDRLRVDSEVFVPLAALGDRQVEDVVEVGWEPCEVAGGQIDRLAPHPGLLECVPRGGIGEAGDALHFVLGGQRLGDGSGDLPGRTRDQDFGAAHGVIVGAQATTTASR